MTGKAGLWAIGGAAAAAGALVASPAAYDRLRRWLGSPPAESLPDLPAAPLSDELGHDTREARLSLRARLAEADELLADPALPSHHRTPERTDSEPLRAAIEGARGRMREKARAAAAWDADE
jgi:hypothetical protein